MILIQLQRNSRAVRIWLGIIFCLVSVSAIAPSSAVAQELEDIVVTRKPGSAKSAKRRGKIVEWKGMSLLLQYSGREREIDNEDIVEIKTTWSQSYSAGLSELRSGKTRVGIEKLSNALSEESRPWAKRIIRAKLVDAYQTIEKSDEAVTQFLELVRDDPQTRFMHLAPLPWAGNANALVQKADTWLAARDPATQLVGASWALAGPNRDKAKKALASLSGDIDPRIRSLAIGQLWRTRTNVSAKQTEVWQGLVEKMPREFRAGPTFVLATAQAQSQKVDEALINWMRIPILYPKQRSLAAAALYRSANLLHNKGDTVQAKSLVNELVSKYPESIWAQQATN